ncbi:helix-turn-helix transcriptional regulator [uncultured Clostridium sp.]|jgi:transcriptional regulator with XRE-family HTH domain|uniref:helix-turn-helix domain-containing protein n=1 Tax=uncultured Clostridium sp. TaxID=59620 RepID=UPI0026135BE4|nr:helix-turn-helix transcriptional regulator [uncultured Clostridium sp.]
MSNLARIRKEKGLSQGELIKLSGISKGAILKYEIGARDINKANGTILFKLATTLNCKMEDLLENKEEIKDDVLFNFYCNWRKKGEDAVEGTDLNFIWDCGEGRAREDFSDYARLEEEITFEKMLELENRY